MRLLQFLPLSILPLVVSAARKPKGGVYEDFHARSLSSSPLKLDDSLYAELTATPRNYSIVILLTALETQFGCQACRDVQPEWDLLAKSWVRGDKSGQSRLLFGTLDFADGKGTFQKLMLQSAPNLFLFQPTVGPDGKPDAQALRYDFSKGALSAEQIHAWISRNLPDGPRPPIVRPMNYLRVITVTTVVLGLITLFSVASPIILPVIQNRNLWAAISIISILLFTSGHMFNHIRKVPYVAGDGRGGISYFAGGFSNQFGLESQIVAAMYGVLSFATISLAMKVPRITDPSVQQISLLAWGAIMLGMYSFLLSVFRIKNGGYPFWLPPF